MSRRFISDYWVDYRLRCVNTGLYTLFNYSTKAESKVEEKKIYIIALNLFLLMFYGRLIMFQRQIKHAKT